MHQTYPKIYIARNLSRTVCSSRSSPTDKNRSNNYKNTDTERIIIVEGEYLVNVTRLYVTNHDMCTIQ